LNGDPATFEFAWYDGDSEQMDLMLTVGRTYYAVVYGWSNVERAGTGTFESDPFGQQWADDMQSQGEFRVSLVGVSPGDDFATDGVTASSIDAFNLNFFDNYIWADIDPEDISPVTSVNSGGCRDSSNIGATAEPGEPAHFPGFPATSSVWFYYEVGAGGTYEFWIEPDGLQPILDPVMAVYRHHTSETFASLGAPLAQGDSFGGSQYPRVTVGGLDAFDRLMIAVDGRDQGTFKLKWRRIPAESPPANDDFADAITLTPGTPISGTTVGATIECHETPVAGWYEGPFGSVWYVFIPTENGVGFLEFDVTSTPNGVSILTDVFQGTSIETLENITPATNYNNGDNAPSTFGYPFVFQAGVPVYVRVQSEYDGVFDASSGGQGGTFDLQMLVQSSTPPGNDDQDDATTVGGGTTGGSTDGSTVEPGETDPHQGGPLDPAAGSVWHRYVPDASGIVAIYATRSDAPVTMWPRVGVWAGDTVGSRVLVNCAQAVRPNVSTGPIASFYEVREGETYMIQVIRDPDQSWGPYVLHVDEYLEYNNWSMGDGFTSTTNSPSISGGVMTVTGNQAISDSLDVLPQYATIDLGTDTPQWGRRVQMYFEVRVVGGQCLFRQMWYGGDDWSFANAASNDHINLTTRSLGLFRARSTDGSQVLVCALNGNSTGENALEFRITNPWSGTDTYSYPVSLGVGGRQHDSGWVGVLVDLSMTNDRRYDGSSLNGDLSFYPNPVWTGRVTVDGRTQTTAFTYMGKQIRYVDWGMYRHPSMNGPGNVGYTDQAYAENNEVWTYQMRRAQISNIVDTEPLDRQYVTDLAVIDFEGFAPGAVALGQTNVQPNQTQGIAGEHQYFARELFFPYPVQYPDYQTETPKHLSAEAAPDKPWSAVHSYYEEVGGDLEGQRVYVKYGRQTGPQRVYAITTRFDAFPAGVMPIAGYSYSTGNPTFPSFSAWSSDIATLIVNAQGELRIKPYGGRDFCVAHLSLNSWYWIEMHVDQEVQWDTKVTIYINGVPFGTFSNALSEADIASFENWNLNGPSSTAPWGGLDYLHAGNVIGAQTGGERATHDFWLTNIVSFRGTHAEIGPLQTVEVNAIDTPAIHAFPDPPEEYFDLLDSNQEFQYRLYDWSYIAQDPGPLNLTDPVGGSPTEIDFPLTGPRFWEPYFRLQATTSGSDGRFAIRDGNYVSGASLTLTEFGQSVPVDVDGITGINVTIIYAPGAATGTVQLMKNGSPVGTAKTTPDATGGGSGEIGFYGDPGDLWGTTWTPNEVNGMGFGVQITGAGNIDKVSIEVFFSDEGAPDDIDRGGILTNAGLYNFYGDIVVASATVTGSGTSGFGFWTGGEPSFITNGAISLSGTPKQMWSALRPLWLWQARGDKIPKFEVTDGSVTAVDLQMLRNPLVYPIYAWSDDDGATYTLIPPSGDSESSNHVGSSAGVSSLGKAIFVDGTGVFDRWLINSGGWSSGFNEDRPSASQAYRHMFWSLAYAGEDTAESQVHAANLWVRWRPYSGPPSTSTGAGWTFHAAITDPQGNRRRVARISRSKMFSFDANPSQAFPFLDRYSQPRNAAGGAWTPQSFNEKLTWVGMTTPHSSGTGFWGSPSGGAAVYAMTWEILVPSEPDPPPGPCESPKYGARIVVKR
jgi:hypothetical protein